eukprot:2420128-Rhodomonas_salina.1
MEECTALLQEHAQVGPARIKCISPPEQYSLCTAGTPHLYCWYCACCKGPSARTGELYRASVADTDALYWLWTGEPADGDA